MFWNLLRLTSRIRGRKTGVEVAHDHLARVSNCGFQAKPKSRRSAESGQCLAVFQGGIDRNEMSVKLYRFLRDNIPALNAAIWTWVKMAASPAKYAVFDSKGRDIRSEDICAVVDNLSRRLYDNRYQKFGGNDALLAEFFNTLFTTGSVCGELLVDPHGGGVDRFYFIDPASIKFKLEPSGEWKMFQQVEGRRISLSEPSTYYFGLDANSVEPWGKSLLSAVPFVARVEQALLSDMNKSMHNAGYHRIHVKVKPPDRMPGEDQNAYVDRANEYFDDTVRMIDNIAPDDNPVTWNDVEIEYIGPASKISSSSSWYVNHKAVVEDICVGTHLAPFMLGYSYGSTQTWAEFNFELLQRQLRMIQTAAARFLSWITEVEFALKGIDAKCRWSFEESVKVGVLEKRKAESVHVDSVLKKLEAGIIDLESAKRELVSDV